MKKLIILLLVSSVNAFSYDGRKCGQMVFGGSHPMSMFFATTGSVTSFISSTGDCSAIAYHSRENKEMFYTETKLELQLDIAKGEGPYLAELSLIYGCSKSEKVNKSLMKSYQSIYKSQKPSNAIDSIMQTQNCKYL